MRAVLRTILVAGTALSAAFLPADSAFAQAAPSAPAQTAPTTPSGPARPTLLPEVGDPANVDEAVLAAKPVLVFSGTSDWDSGLKNLRASFAKIEQELKRLNIAPAGRPLVVYTQTTDDNFKFDAMIPIAAPPATTPSELAKDMRFGETPAGKAYRFVHKGAYDDIDNTYETITTYLEAKDIVARDAFIEEFVNDIAESSDANLEINIFVQPK